MNLYLYNGEVFQLELSDVVLHDSGAAKSAWVVNGAWELAGDGEYYWAVERPANRWSVEGTSLRSVMNDLTA